MGAQESSLGELPCHYAEFLAYAGLQRCAHPLVNARRKRGQSLMSKGGEGAPEPRGGSSPNGETEMDVLTWWFRLCTIGYRSRRASLYSSLLHLVL